MKNSTNMVAENGTTAKKHAFILSRNSLLVV